MKWNALYSLAAVRASCGQDGGRGRAAVAATTRRACGGRGPTRWRASGRGGGGGPGYWLGYGADRGGWAAGRGAGGCTAALVREGGLPASTWLSLTVGRSAPLLSGTSPLRRTPGRLPWVRTLPPLTRSKLLGSLAFRIQDGEGLRFDVELNEMVIMHFSQGLK